MVNKKLDDMEEQFSYYNPPITNTTPEREPYSLSRVYSIIISDELRGDIEKIRTLTAQEFEKERKQAKSKLPFVTFGGIFDYRAGRRTAEEKGYKGLLQSSGLVNIDLDHITKGGYNVETLKKTFAEDPELGARLIFTSPSGDGLKIVSKCNAVITSEDDYKMVFKAICNYIKKVYSIPEEGRGQVWGIDKQVNDISRGCYLSYDPTAIYLTSGEFNTAKYQEEEKESSPVSERFFSPSSLRDDVEIVLQRIEAQRLDITGNQTEWVIIGYALANAFGESGREYFHRVSRFYPTYTRKEAESKYNRCLQNPQATIGAFFNRAKEYGIDIYTETSLQRENEEEREIRKTLHKQMNSTPGITAQEAVIKPNGADKGQQSTKGRDYSEMLEIDDFEAILKEEDPGILTGYSFMSKADNIENKEEVSLKIPSGEITLICGMSGHCKSTFLRNLFVNMRENTEGDLLYFSFEESKKKTYKRILSTFMGEITSLVKQERERKEREFSSLVKSGKFRIYTPDYTASQLIEAIRYYQSSGRAVGAVFIDYIQILKSGQKTQGRTEEVTAVIETLHNFSKESNIPIIFACQLNRQTKSPSAMGANNIADSADLTRYAGLIINLWYNQKGEDITDDKYITSTEGKRLSDMGFTPGDIDNSRIYAKITKTREEGLGYEAVLDYVGRTGLIRGNDFPEDKPTTATHKERKYKKMTSL